MRLNKALREEIVRRVMDDSPNLQDKQEKLETLATATAITVLADLYRGHLPETIKAAQDVVNRNLELIPDTLVATGDITFRTVEDEEHPYKLGLYCQGEWVDIFAKGLAIGTILPRGRNHVKGAGAIKAVELYRKEKERLKTLKLNTRIELLALVDSVTTSKKLLEIWPEVGSYLPEEGKPTGTALSINVASLNETLGIQ